MRRAPGNQRPKKGSAARSSRPPGRAAQRADLVTELDGTPVRDAADLQLRLALLKDRRSRRIRHVAPRRRGEVRAARNASRPRATVPGTKPPGIRAREGHLQSATHSCVTYGPYVTQNRKEGPHMSTKSALRADLDAEDRKTLAEDRKRMERLGKGSQLDDWLAFGPGLLIRRRLAKNIAGLARD